MSALGNTKNSPPTLDCSNNPLILNKMGQNVSSKARKVSGGLTLATEAEVDKYWESLGRQVQMLAQTAELILGKDVLFIGTDKADKKKKYLFISEAILNELEAEIKRMKGL